MWRPVDQSRSGRSARRRRTAAWTATNVILVGAVVMAATGAPQANPPTAESEAAATDLSADEARAIRLFRQSLLGPNRDMQTRRDAATLLVGMNRNAGYDLIVEAIADDDPQIVTAAADAVAALRDPPPRLRSALLQRLRRAGAALIPPLSEAIAAFGRVGMDDLIALIDDADETPVARANAAAAMVVYGNDAIDPLAATLGDDTDPTGTPEVTAAVCAALTRITRLDHGDDVDAWRAWYREAEAQPDAALLREQVEALRARNTELNQQIKDVSAESAAVMARHIETLRDLWPLVKLEDQFRRLPGMLKSDLTAERRFAAERIGRLLRDAIPIPQPVQIALAERVTDRDRQMRLEALRLLDEINYADIGPQLVRLLESERDMEVANRALIIAAERPSAALAGAAMRWLGEGSLKAAADLLWAAMQAGVIDAEQASAIGEVALTEFSSAPSAPMGRLAARFADEKDATGLEARLDDGDPAIAAAVAEGFSVRGRTEPLLQRARSATIFPWAVHGLVTGEPTIAAFERLLHLRGLAGDDETRREVWRSGLDRLGVRLGDDDLLSADDTLRGYGTAVEQVREAMLRQFLQRPATSEDARRQSEATGRLAQILIDADRPDEAFTLLAGLNGDLTDQHLQSMKFRAAVHSGRYDAAMAVSDAPDAWINQLEVLAVARAGQARGLRDAITTRMGSRLTPEQQARFDAVARLIPAAPASADSADASTDSDAAGS